MALPRDPETLRVPAFMRKRNIRTRLARPLLLTALDRKNAGVVLPELQKPKRKIASRKLESRLPRRPAEAGLPRNDTSYSWPMLPLHERQEPEIKPKPRKTRSRTKRKQIASSPRRDVGAPRNDTAVDYFTEPLLGFEEPEEVKPRKTRRAMVPAYAPRASAGRREPHHDTTVGTITHYYGKIEVGVIKLKGALSVGDCISYETPEGDYEQIVESMEIDRVPVFKAKKGDDIGLKLRKIAKVGSPVVKI